jgi:hypothetical protein
VDLAVVAGFFVDAIRSVDTLAAVDLAEGMKRPRGSPTALPLAWFQPPPRS